MLMFVKPPTSPPNLKARAKKENVSAAIPGFDEEKFYSSKSLTPAIKHKQGSSATFDAVMPCLSGKIKS